MMKKLTAGLLGVAIAASSVGGAYSATPEEIERDMFAALQARAGLSEQMQAAPGGVPDMMMFDQPGSENAVLGVQAAPTLGILVAAPVAQDLLTALRNQAQEGRTMATLPVGLPTDR